MRERAGHFKMWKSPDEAKVEHHYLSWIEHFKNYDRAS